MWRNRDGIFLLEWRSHERRKKNFPMNHERHIMYGGAGVVKINFPMSGEAASGEILFLPQLLSHEWGKIVTRMGIAMYLE